jgi:hypothetical protein
MVLDILHVFEVFIEIIVQLVLLCQDIVSYDLKSIARETVSSYGFFNAINPKLPVPPKVVVIPLVQIDHLFLPNL